MSDFLQKTTGKSTNVEIKTKDKKSLSQSLENIFSPYKKMLEWLNPLTINLSKEETNSFLLNSLSMQPILSLLNNFKQEKKERKIKKQAKPFFYKGNEVGIILTHGFSSTPQEMKGLGEYLHEKFNYTTYGVLLAGHGTSPADLAQTDMFDWYKSLRKAYFFMREICNKIILIGHSMGGTLSLILAADKPIDGIVSICTPVNVEYFMQEHLYLISDFICYFPRRKEERKVMEKYNLINYRISSLKGVQNLLDIMEVAKEEMPKVTAPIFTITAGLDKRVPLYNAEMIRKLVNSKIKKDYFAKDVHHTILFSDEKELVFKKIQKFIKSII